MYIWLNAFIKLRIQILFNTNIDILESIQVCTHYMLYNTTRHHHIQYAPALYENNYRFGPLCVNRFLNNDNNTYVSLIITLDSFSFPAGIGDSVPLHVQSGTETPSYSELTSLSRS